MANKMKLAAVVDALADHFDAIEAEKTATAQATRQSAIDELASKYAAATGEELPAEARKKLAESDEEVVSLLRTLTEKHAGLIEPLGGPSERNDEAPVLNKKEAADAAYDRFGNWLTS